MDKYKELLSHLTLSGFTDEQRSSQKAVAKQLEALAEVQKLLVSGAAPLCE